MSAHSSCELSVIVPTYNEAPNIRPLCDRLFTAARSAGLTIEVLIVDDDSGEGTVKTESIVQQLQAEKYDVRLHVRRRREGRGLSSAVLIGFQKAKYNVMLCMDADLQHLPEDVPRVAQPVLLGQAEFSVGSRHVEGGCVAGWTLKRKIISAGATALAWPIARSTDPMSGLFCLRRDVLARGRNLNPMGFKIALELAVKCNVRTLKDVPITFGDRIAGESKLSMKTNILYLTQLAGLYWFKFKWAIILSVLICLCTIGWSTYYWLFLPPSHQQQLQI
jgi:dolichol-phosphate mannosyltransferase